MTHQAGNLYSLSLTILVDYIQAKRSKCQPRSSECSHLEDDIVVCVGYDVKWGVIVVST